MECTIRKWGNSLGITIPKEFAEKESLLENQKVEVSINKKKTTFQKAFGVAKGWKIDVQKMKDELREDWDR